MEEEVETAWPLYSMVVVGQERAARPYSQSHQSATANETRLARNKEVSVVVWLWVWVWAKLRHRTWPQRTGIAVDVGGSGLESENRGMGDWGFEGGVKMGFYLTSLTTKRVAVLLAVLVPLHRCTTAPQHHLVVMLISVT